MRKSFLFVCSLSLLVGMLIGCTAKEKTEGSGGSSLPANGTAAQPVSDGKQYRALCVEKAEHGGNEYVLSKWMDSREKADELGKYHGDFKYKGHAWRIEERVKPEKAKP